MGCYFCYQLEHWLHFFIASQFLSSVSAHLLLNPAVFLHPVQMFIVYGTSHSKSKGSIVCLWAFLIPFFSCLILSNVSCRIYLSENTSFVFLPIMEGGLRQPVVMQHFHTILLSVLRWESSVSVHRMFLWSKIQLLVGLVPQWDVALC